MQVPRKQVPQTPVEAFSYISHNDTIDWKTIESGISSSRKESVATALTSFFADINSVSENGPHFPLANAIHLVDLNGDGQLDAVYAGSVGAESDAVWLFLNNNGQYRKLQQEWWGEVKQLSFQHGRLASLTLLDFGCCAEYIEFESTYAFDQALNAKLVRQRGTAAFTQRPTSLLLSSPGTFQLVTDSITLRTRPMEDDTSTLVYDAVGKGNILLKFGKGAKGIAWASKIDSVGHKWKYVEMLPAKSSGYLMYSKDDFPTYTFGWIQAKNID